MNNKKKLDILLDRWRDEMNGHLTRGAVDEALCVSGAEPLTPTPHRAHGRGRPPRRAV
jgi:hypothetical protein